MLDPNFYYLIFDWETGGLDSTKHACVELAMIAVRSDNFEEIGRISTLIAPYGNFQYTEKALEINKTTLDEIIEGRDVKEVAGNIISLAESCKINSRDGKAVLVAHNSDFDRSFIQQIFEATNNSKEMPKIFAGSNDYYGNFQPHCIDSIDLARLKWHKNKGEVSNYKLGTCLSKVGVDLVGAHKAINDTIALRDLFLHFKKCLRSDGLKESSSESRVRDKLKFEF